MLTRRTIVVMALFTGALPASTGAQWSQTGGPFGAYLYDLGVSGANVIAAAEGGIYTSGDGGSHWSSTLAVAGAVTALAPGGTQQVWAGTSNGVFLSTDNGMTWSNATTVTVNGYVSAMASVPAEVIASVSGGLFRSTDLGVSWGDIGTGLPGVAANVVMIDGGNIWVGLQNSPHALYRSSDTGGSWQYADSGLTPKDVRSILPFAGRLFSSTWGGGVFVSSDSGRTWTGTSNGIVGSIVQRIIAFGTRLCAISDYGVFVSADTGKTWTPTGSLPMAGYGNGSLASSGSLLFTGGVDGVHASTDTGAVWTLRNDGMRGTGVPGLVAGGGAILAGTYEDGVAISTDGGTTWTYSNSGLPGHILYTLQGAGGVVWEGGNIGAYRSTDSGAHWAAANSGFGGYNPTNSFDPRLPLLYSGGSLGVFVSSDSGASWTKISTGLPVKPVRSVFVVSATGPTMMAGTYDTLYRSTDGGGSWSAVKRVVANQILRFAGDLYAATESGVMISTDEGVSWSSANQNINPLSCYAFAVSGNNLFLGASAGLFRTTGRGKGWTDVGTGLPQTGVASLLAEGASLYAGTGSDGVWKRPLLEIVTGAGPAARLPAHPSLEQNYPNPFNPRTVIHYGLPRRSRVTLAVYNTIGQLVATLVNAEEEAGDHEVAFGGGVASGVYLYRMQSGDFFQVRKMTLIR